MAIIKCKMCGGDLVIEQGLTVAECEYCGTTQTVPNADNEKKVTLFARANRLRAGNEFDKASGIYESIVADFPEEAEAYWGLVLCKYGIEYVDDPATAKKIPTCHRSSFESVMDDNNFELTLEYADVVARKVYREEAKQIEEIRKGIIEVSSKEEPYDVFICYKETDEKGDRTIDSVLAQDIYDALTNKGYRTFFARITLEDKLGQEYEPYIFAALNSAKIMLAVGTDYEYYNAVWVKNEWSRFLKLMATDKSKHLIPCYKNIDAYDMPKEFAKLQAQDLGKVGAMQDLLRGIEKILPKQKAEVVKETVIVQQSSTTASSPNVDSLLKRAFMFLEDSDWKSADEYCEKVLDIDPECAEAYLGKLLAEMKLNKRENLKNATLSIQENANYQKAVRFGSEALKNELKGYAEFVDKQLKLAELYRDMENMEIVDGVLEKYNGKNSHVTIPDGITSIGECAFNGCDFLESIIIPDSVTSMDGWSFEGCKNLKDIIVSDKNKVFIMKNRCLINKNEKEIIFGFDDAVIPSDGSIISIGERAFRGCGFASITIPDSVTNIGNWAFDACDALFSITIPDGVTSIGYRAFSFCNSLSSIIIPNSVTIIDDWAFYACESLVSINIPDSVAIIGNEAFAFCESLTSITISNSVTSIGDWAFNGCENLKDIIVSDKNKVFTMKSRCLINKNKKEVIFALEDATIPSDGSVTSVGEGAFLCCQSHASITIPDSVTSIGDEAFNGCESLTSITIPDSVTNIGWAAFDDCKKLTIFASSNSFAAQYAKRNGINTIDKVLEAKKAAHRQAGLCQHCGGSFKGLFTKKCSACGRAKDY